MDPQTLLARERSALGAHRATMRGAGLPGPAEAPRGTFAHGLLLPVSILAAVLRSPELRRPFLRLTAVRWAFLAVAAVVVVLGTDFREKHEPRSIITVSRDADSSSEPVAVDAPGLHVRLNDEHGDDQVVVLGKSVPVVHVDEDGEPRAAPAASATPPQPSAPPTWTSRMRDGFSRGWAGIVALVGSLSMVEFFLVVLTRRWDDWMSFHVSRLAAIRPEAAEPPQRKITLDVRWMLRKLRRRVRGYFVIGSGMPVLYLFEAIPVAGHALFVTGATLWAWYWIGVFTASKSAHAWVDEGTVSAPPWLRRMQQRVATGCLAWPLRVYARIWAWLLRGVSAPAETFGRSPAPFLGLALARAFFALPGLYVLVRPIVPVAAGRLCAEADPQSRFWTQG